MDFGDTPEQAGYRRKAREWIEANAADLPRRQGRRPATADELALARQWQARKAEAGYACIDWAAELGGAGGSPIERIVFEEEERRAGLEFVFFRIGLGICVPTVARFGSPKVRAARVAPAIRGEEIWCQLFSEPGAGSDLAAAATRAERIGDGWKINGRKVWTSYAQFSDYGLLLARTDPSATKHAGLSLFWVSMRSPGLTVRPIRQMSGEADFNEVTLEDVWIDDAQRLGEPGDGWKLIRYALMNERLAVSSVGGLDHRSLIAVAREAGAVDDPTFRDRLADFYVTEQGLELMRQRTITALARGEAPGPENAIGKLVAASSLLEMAHYALSLQGAMGIVDDPAHAMSEGRFQHALLWAPGYRLGGGSDEMLRNIIAERVLGLPAQAHADAGIPWNERTF